jgi:hypothetical protein
VPDWRAGEGYSRAEYYDAVLRAHCRLESRRQGMALPYKSQISV